jgi:hypothetical protein
MSLVPLSFLYIVNSECLEKNFLRPVLLIRIRMINMFVITSTNPPSIIKQKQEEKP